MKDVDSRVFTRMLRKDGRTDGSVTISLRNFVGDGITKQSQKEEKKKTLTHNYRTTRFTSIKSGEVKLVLWSQTTPYKEMMR